MSLSGVLNDHVAKYLKLLYNLYVSNLDDHNGELDIEKSLKWAPALHLLHLTFRFHLARLVHGKYLRVMYIYMYIRHRTMIR